MDGALFSITLMHSTAAIPLPRAAVAHCTVGCDDHHRPNATNKGYSKNRPWSRNCQFLPTAEARRRLKSQVTGNKPLSSFHFCFGHALAALRRGRCFAAAGGSFLCTVLTRIAGQNRLICEAGLCTGSKKAADMEIARGDASSGCAAPVLRSSSSKPGDQLDSNFSPCQLGNPAWQRTLPMLCEFQGISSAGLTWGCVAPRFAPAPRKRETTRSKK